MLKNKISFLVVWTVHFLIAAGSLLGSIAYVMGEGDRVGVVATFVAPWWLRVVEMVAYVFTTPLLFLFGIPLLESYSFWSLVIAIFLNSFIVCYFLFFIWEKISQGKQKGAFMSHRFTNIVIITTLVIIVAGGEWWYFNKSSTPTIFETAQLPTSGTQPVVNNQLMQPVQNPIPRMTTFNVYFGKENDPSDPTSTLCARVIARTVPYTSAIAEVALVELFKGPTANEKQQGYYSCFFDTDIVVKSLKIENGIATVDFSKEYTEGCGGASSCSQAARNAVRNTLTQFSSVKSVQILINGVPERGPEGYDA